MCRNRTFLINDTWEILYYMPNFVRNGVVYAQTTVSLPVELREQARERGFELSSTLVLALKKRIEESAGSGQ